MKFLKNKDAIIVLIAVNVAVFMIYHVVLMIFMLFKLDVNILDSFLAMPSNFDSLIRQPWTIVTYMFFHKGILHILFNMLWLYWFGRIFRMYFSGWQLTNVYILGGFTGALLYFMSYNFFPALIDQNYNSVLLGASGGVLAVVLAIACYVPRYTINLFILGRVKLITIALVSIALDIISISKNDNAGGHIAHLGGALLGYLFAKNILKGKDITAWFGRFCAWIGSFFKPKPKLRVTYKRPPTDDREYNRLKHEKQQEIDHILDKISKGGYDSLSRQEKETLFNQKNR